jgi:hypothetical protein
MSIFLTQAARMLAEKVEQPERIEHVCFIFEDFEEKFTAGEVIVENVIDTVAPNVL